LSPEDCGVQSMTEASPVKWHLAHTTWFFETFLLPGISDSYRVFDSSFCFLFNSYYETIGERVAREDRGLLARPTLEEVFAYRRHVDKHVTRALRKGALSREQHAVLQLGFAHEEQHQELILTDLKHHLSRSPLRPAYRTHTRSGEGAVAPLRFHAYEEGLRLIGVAEDAPGFSFDNEGPRHRVFVEGFELASRPVTVGEYLEFMSAGGYEEPRHWLSDGWARVKGEGWRAPLYWEEREGAWWTFTMSGMRPVDANEAVCHVSYYEADAFATWAGARLPREAEWEVAASEQAIEGNFVESRTFHPRPTTAGEAPGGLFGDVWEWTQSPYVAYPGYRVSEGALGEYNGKFMCNQLVLRGGSCASPKAHLRASYRNFFQPELRWQFSGLRLARDL
jgi:ergothioneine biosynthesis protein EgtB